MPWEIRILGESDRPLGNKAEVIEWVRLTLGGVELRRPPLPPPEVMATFSPAVREAFAWPKLEALFEQNDFTIELYCGYEDPIRCLYADVRGSGNPLPVLARLCLPKHWRVISSADKSCVDLTASTADQWQSFCNWRDDAIRQLQDEERQ